MQSQLNTTELAWAPTKGYATKHSKVFTQREIERLTLDGFRHTTTDMWRDFCRHVVSIESQYIEKGGTVGGHGGGGEDWERRGGQGQW